MAIRKGTKPAIGKERRQQLQEELDDLNAQAAEDAEYSLHEAAARLFELGWNAKTIAQNVRDYIKQGLDYLKHAS